MKKASGLGLAASAVLVLALGLGVAQAEDLADYDPRSDAWNGMSAFVGLAGGMGFDVDVRGSLEWGDLSANDVLFLVYPLQRVDPGKLAAFVQAGGNVAIADDFGEGKDAMTGLGLRLDVGIPTASRHYEGREWAPIAGVSAKDHPLALELEDNPEHGVVTNHPAAFKSASGATEVVGFDDGAVVVAGERGTGRFVAIADPSIFINRMQQFAGDTQLAVNVLNWLARDGRAHRLVLLRGDAAMFGEPRPFIDDPQGGKLGRSISDLNLWLSKSSDWLLIPGAMKALAAALAAVLLVLAILALPVRRGPKIDGGWLRWRRPARRDEPHGLVDGADRGGSLLVLACILRDHVQRLLESEIHRPEPLYTLPERELVAHTTSARGAAAGAALSRVYPRLRALPSRGQAAAPWSVGVLPRREFDALYRDVAELCRTLGSELSEP